MGQGGSVEFKEAFQSTVGQLSEIQFAEIGSRYMSSAIYCISMILIDQTSSSIVIYYRQSSDTMSCTDKLEINEARS